jgi:hypothetical protein
MGAASDAILSRICRISSPLVAELRRFRARSRVIIKKVFLGWQSLRAMPFPYPLKGLMWRDQAARA